MYGVLKFKNTIESTFEEFLEKIFCNTAVIIVLEICTPDLLPLN